MSQPSVPTGSLTTACEKSGKMYELLGQKNPKTGKKIIVQTLPNPGTLYAELIRRCGQCLGCRMARSMELGLRLEHESQFHDQSWFITLTYADENLPEANSLKANHMSIFIKALRQDTRQKIRFFGAGEYAPDTLRPHYHLIIFGLDLPDRIYAGTSDAGNVFFRSETISKAWRHRGRIQVDSVSPATMQYVTKYHIDKINGEQAEKHYSRPVIDELTGEYKTVQVEQESARMSRNPGMGRKWIEKYYEDIFRHGFIGRAGGARTPIPTYYERWCEKQHPELYLKHRQDHAQQRNLEDDLENRFNAKMLNRKARRAIYMPGRNND